MPVTTQTRLILLSTLLIILCLLSACAAQAPAQSGGAAPSAQSSSSEETDSAPATGYGTSSEAPNGNNQQVSVTAGVTDDNVEWQAYLDYLARNRHIYANQRDVSERYLIQVTDEAARPVHDALVEIYVGDALFFTGRTDTGGQLYFHPLALDSYQQAQQQVVDYRVKATKGFVASSQRFARYDNAPWQITLTEPPANATTRLDLLFLIDATGSMGDEIDKLKNSMAEIADQIATLPEAPDVRYGLVAYRDRGDAFVVRTYDFTPDLQDFQRSLAALRADGGGDEPEALNEALHRSLYELSWREETVRLVILVADAPPHLDYSWEDFSYDSDMIEAVGMGIKLFPVGASNLNAEGEYIFRQLAQFTGGKFVFLTYADGDDPSSGPGTETNHDVDVYSVDSLDRLVVRLVREELAKLSTVYSANQPVASQPSPIPTPTPQPQQPISCTIDLMAKWHNCEGIGGIQLGGAHDNAAVLQLLLRDNATYYTRVRFDITYDRAPVGTTVHIAEDSSVSSPRPQRDQASVQVIDDELLVYGNGDIPEREQLNQEHQLFVLPDVVQRDTMLSLEVTRARVGINYPGGIEVVESPYLFSENPLLNVAFNRSINGEESGTGVSQVVVTLYPAQ